ncbi:hypothetical protein BDV18DRAFT_135709 [Aspergillus unguis]
MATRTATTAFMSTTLVTPFEKNCPTCGQAPESESETANPHPAEFTRRRVKDLEGQIQTLNNQAAQMSEKLVEYETEVRRLRAQSSAQPALSSLTPRNSTSTAHSEDSLSRTQSPSQQQLQQPQPQQQQSRLSSLASLLPYRRPSTASSQPQSQPQTQAQNPPRPQLHTLQTTQSLPEPQTQLESPLLPQTPTPRPSSDSIEARELQNALNHEQNLRKAAETQLTQASTELEELTVQLFSQANEMVAQERKARVRLEERVAVLERRDVEKRARLERLEKAMARVERIRALVG